MKTKAFVLTACLFLGSFAWMGCEKVIDEKQLTINNPYDDFPDIVDRSLIDKLENEDGDIEDTKMNTILYHLSQGLASFATEDDLMEIVYDQAMLEDDGEVSYSKLVALDIRFKTLMNDYLKPTCFPTKPTGFDCLAELDALMIYDGVDYYPVVIVPNTAELSANKKPVVCVGTEIDDADNIIGLKVHNNGTVTQTLVGETQAQNTSIPIIIFTNGTDHVESFDVAGIIEYDNTGTIPTPASDIVYKFQDYGIYDGFRYEAWGKSEYDYYVTFHDDLGNVLEGSFMFIDGVEKGRIDRIKKTEVESSTVFTNQKDFVTISHANHSVYNNVYITTYERDWYASKKEMATCLPTFVGRHKVNTKYSNNWYCNFVCGQDWYYTLMTTVSSGSSWSNIKAQAAVIRTQ